MARPKLEIDPNLVEELAGINCTVQEISAVIGCDKRTLERRFAAEIEKGRERGKSSLKRKMWETAQGGNVVMMIWLSKQMLGYTEKVVNVQDQKLLEDAKKLKEMPQAKLISLVEKTVDQAKKENANTN